MSIRIEDGARFVEFRDSKWTFGDRRAILAAPDDVAALETVLPYVVSWSLPVPVTQSVDGLNEAEDDDVVFVIRSWFRAREQRSGLPKAS